MQCLLTLLYFLLEDIKIIIFTTVCQKSKSAPFEKAPMTAKRSYQAAIVAADMK